jgi:hypothetical protein
MKSIRIQALPFMIALLALTLPAFAADVDGKWTGTLSTPMGDIPVSYEFKADGKVLAGTTHGFDGATQVPVKNGTIDGNKIAFSVSFDFGGTPLEISYTGVVTPTEIQITGDFMGMPFEYTVKKG